jgi:predicted chitinase
MLFETALTTSQISAVTDANPANVRANWPLVINALDWAGINSRLTQIGMAATIAIETRHFLPIKEKKSNDSASDVYRAQQKYWGSGFYGRGYIQLTWHDNYAMASKALGIDLIAEPDLALQPEIAAKIAAWFFKLRLIHSLCERRDWESVRRLVNGPGYRMHTKSLQNFLHYCKLLDVQSV